VGFSIGNIKLKHGLLLAPMAGVTDHAFRILCREYGAEMSVSEMVSAKAIYYKDEKTAELACVYSDDKPFAIQIFSSEPQIAAFAAKELEAGSYNACRSHRAPDVIDINMGCPVKKIVSNGEGSALMKDPELAHRIVKAVSDAVNIPVTVKIRAGWSEDRKNAVEMALALAEGGAAAICVHGRTREQFYSPPVDLDIIAEVKRSVKVPVIGNGSIYTAADAINMFSHTGCDGIMIARGADGNPFLFEEIVAALEGRDYISPTPREKMEVAKRHIELIKQDKGERYALLESRRHLSLYAKGMHGATSFRNAVNAANNTCSLIKLIDELCDSHESAKQ